MNSQNIFAHPFNLNIYKGTDLMSMSQGKIHFNKDKLVNTKDDSKNTLSCESYEPSETNKRDLKLNIYICPEPTCMKQYSCKSRLIIHLRTHTGEKPYSYEVCNKSFNEKGNLKIHMRIHTGEKPYVCNFEGCSKSFKAYGHLADHMKRHLNIKYYLAYSDHMCVTFVIQLLVERTL